MPDSHAQTKIRILLVDDHALVRKQLTEVIQGESDLAVCGEAEDVSTAALLVSREAPHLVILDLSLKQSSGFDFLQHLHKMPAKPIILVLSMHEECVYVRRSLQLGASGYITKEDAARHLMQAVRRVLAGQRYLSEELARKLEEAPQSYPAGAQS